MKKNDLTIKTIGNSRDWSKGVYSTVEERFVIDPIYYHINIHTDIEDDGSDRLLCIICKKKDGLVDVYSDTFEQIYTDLQDFVPGVFTLPEDDREIDDYTFYVHGKNNEYQLLNTRYESINFPPKKYKYIRYLSKYVEYTTFFLVRYDSKLRVIDENEEVWMEFNEELEEFIDLKGETKQEMQYEVKIDGKSVVLDSDGNVILHKYRYDYIYADNPYSEFVTFHDGLVGVKVGSKWGYINEKEEVVIEPTFQFARPFKNGFAEVLPYYPICSTAYGVINKKGEWVEESRCRCSGTGHSKGKWYL
ncbi:MULTISPECIES: WG repeat-containing protein [Cytobacillus]|uniref:WG repeat-containing protein n=3 Tax=Bacillati TaxID=1783272 RepID=A0A2N0ZIF4_9BACI|nr:WG repeat-containing protein [Cytobacillus horneckiae]MEC1159277.1 WG repeat-containing protein [Cytobacillus horneckiae]PKG29283.1 hypothetical protein CWS20_09310 [Cytobacillus horneckiae]